MIDRHRKENGTKGEYGSWTKRNREVRVSNLEGDRKKTITNYEDKVT
jgi:hypothetical protein